MQQTSREMEKDISNKFKY